MRSDQDTDIQLLAVKRIDDDRRVVHVKIGPISIKSIWITGMARGHPRISWPETGKGYPIVTAEPKLKARIDSMILDRICGASAPAPRRALPRRRSRSTGGSGATDRTFFDDPLDDILPMRVK